MPFLTTTGVLPVTCEVGLSRSVRAFHIMPGLPGPEGQLHDHDYRIEIVVDREQLDDRGMVCDLDILEARLTELTSRVEGRNLEEIRPADAEAVTVEVCGRCRCRRRRGIGREGVGNSLRFWRVPRTMLRLCLLLWADRPSQGGRLNLSGAMFVCCHRTTHFRHLRGAVI